MLALLTFDTRHTSVHVSTTRLADGDKKSFEHYLSHQVIFHCDCVPNQIIERARLHLRESAAALSRVPYLTPPLGATSFRAKRA